MEKGNANGNKEIKSKCKEPKSWKANLIFNLCSCAERGNLRQILPPRNNLARRPNKYFKHEMEGARI